MIYKEGERTYHHSQFCTRPIDKPPSYPVEPAEVLMLWRHITEHYFKTPFKAITPVDYMPPMFPHPINTDLPPQINFMKDLISVNIMENFLDHPKLTNNTIRCMFLYYVETYKRHHCHPHGPPCNAPQRKVL